MNDSVITTRAELMDLLGLDEDGMAQAAREREAFVQAWHLQQLRKSRGLSQRAVASEMHVSQPRVHEIEHGNFGKTGVDVLRAYVAALGGKLEITAHIDGETYRMA